VEGVGGRTPAVSAGRAVWVVSRLPRIAFEFEFEFEFKNISNESIEFPKNTPNSFTSRTQLQRNHCAHQGFYCHKMVIPFWIRVVTKALTLTLLARQKTDQLSALVEISPIQNHPT